MAPRKPKVITIVGGGFAASFIVDALKRNFDPALLPLEVRILEAGDEFIQGLAWSPDNVTPSHLVNQYYDEDEIEQIVEHTDTIDDTRIRGAINARGEMSRDLASAHHRAMYYTDVNELQHKGIDCKHVPFCNIVDIGRDDEGFTLVDSEGKEHRSDFVILATGHWQGQAQSRKNWEENVHPSPWPAARLKTIPVDTSVAVLGSSLSAVDAFMTLAENAGRFETKSGELVFTPKHPGFHIDCYSRSGLLPSVLGYLADVSDITHIAELYVALPDINDRHVTMQEIYQNVRDPVLKYIEQHSDPSPVMKEIAALISDTSLTYQAAIAMWEKRSRETNADPCQSLGQQLQDAMQSFETKHSFWYQKILRILAPYIEEAYRHMGAEDQDYFMRHVQPLYNKLAYGMVISNAEKVHALLKSNVLRMHALGQEHTISSVKGGVEIEYTDQSGQVRKDFHPKLVRATGDDPYTLHNSSPLMQKLFKYKFASEMLTPYDDQEKGCVAYDEQQHRPEKGNVRRVSQEGRATYYRSGGGLQINPKTYELLPPPGCHAGNGKLYAMGAPIGCYSPLLVGIPPLQRASNAIVGSIRERITHKPPEKPKNLKEDLMAVLNPYIVPGGVLQLRGPVSNETEDTLIARAAQSVGLKPQDLHVAYTQSKDFADFLQRVITAALSQ